MKIIMKKEKCVVLFVALITVVLLAILSSNLRVFEKSHDTSSFTSISPSDAAIALELKDRDMIIYCGQDTCGACRAFTPLVAKMANEVNLDIYYLDVDLISSQKELEKWQIQETPTLIVISDGKNWIYRGTLSKDDLYKACMNHSIKIAPVNSLEEVSYADLTAMMNEPLDFVLYIGRDDCRDCQKFMPILEQYINNESTGVVYLNIKDYRSKAIAESATEDDKAFYENLTGSLSISWVPTLIHVRYGIQVSRYEFLSREYYELPARDQAAAEEEAITEFHRWMSRETIGYKDIDG